MCSSHCMYMISCLKDVQDLRETTFLHFKSSIVSIVYGFVFKSSGFMDSIRYSD